MTTNRGAFLERSRDAAAEWSAKGVTRWAVVLAVLLFSGLLAYRAPGGRAVYMLIALGPALVIAFFILRRLPAHPHRDRHGHRHFAEPGDPVAARRHRPVGLEHGHAS